MHDTSKSKLGILAGGGRAPLQVIQACQAMGRPFFVFCLEGHASPDLGEGWPHVFLPLGALQTFKEICLRESIAEIVMIGHVRRPSLSEIKPDWLALKMLTKIGLHALGDDGLLRSLGKALEDECGVRVIGIADIMTDLLTPVGVLTVRRPEAQAQADMARGVSVAHALGLLDVGQAVIVQQGLVLGVEAIEGTAALIARAGAFKRDGGGGVLVKLAKPQQDHRYDLPSIGVDTIIQLRDAGFAGVAIEAGRSLLLDREKMIETANDLGLFITGFEQDEKL